MALGLTLLLAPWLYPTVTPLFFVAVMVSAWFGGWKTGFLAALLSTLAVSYFFIQPLYSWQIFNVGTVVRLGMFAIAVGLIHWLNHLRHKTLRETGEREAVMQAEGAQTEQALRQVEEKYRTVLTSLRHSEAQQAFLLQLNDRLRSLIDPEVIQFEAARLLGEHLGADRVGYAEDQGDGETIVVTRNYTNGVPGIEGRYRYDDYGSDLLRELGAGRTVIRPDIAHDPTLTAAEKEAHAMLQLGAAVNVPLMKAGRLIAVLFLHYQEAHSFSENEVALLTAVAERTWDAVERARAEAALRASEAKYRSLFNSIDEGFCLIEMMFDETNKAIDYRYLEVNAVFERQTGLKNVVGKLGSEVSPQTESHWFEDYGNVARTGKPLRVENYHAFTGRWYSAYASRVGGLSNCWVAIVFDDITERKRTEEKLRYAAEINAFRVKLSDVLRSLTSPLEIQAEACRLLGEHLDVDRAYYVEVNEAESYARVDQNYLRGDSPSLVGVFRLADYGWTVPLLKRGETIVVTDAETSDIIPAIARTAMAAVRIAAHISVPLIKAGALVGALCVTEAKPCQWLETEIELVRETAERIWAAVEHARVEVEREQLLMREQTARENADHANRVKDEFLAVLSHELRSPLNPILGWAKLLRQGKLDSLKTQRALEAIERNAQLQSELIEDLLDVSRILRGKLNLNVAPVNLEAMVRSAMETVRLAAQAKAIDVRFKVSEEARGVRGVRVEGRDEREVSSSSFLPFLIVQGDATRLQQVVWNLLSNAVKFTPAGGCVSVKLESVGDYAQITVHDTGKGITPEFLPRVFDYFQQEDGATTRKFGGLGLGLAIVRQLVELHGGVVWAESQGEGLGATFTVRLPLMRAGDRELEPDERAPRPSSSALRTPLEGLKILIVDDETDSRDFTTFVVEQAGASVKTAASGAEAIALLTQSQIDVVLSDVGMPEMDGYMLMQHVRRLPPEQNGQVKAIALTAYAGDFNQQQALQAGFQRHVAKPVEPQALVEIIATLCASIIPQER